MSAHRTYVRIEGEPFLSAAKEFRERIGARVEAYREFAVTRGAESIPDHGHGLNFGGKAAPSGWTKPKGKLGYSAPKKGHADVVTLAELRKAYPLPTNRDVFGDAICENLSYEGPGECWGGGGIGYLFGAMISWYGDTFYAIVADAEAAVRDHLASHPGSRITNGADTWRMPDGLKRLSDAEFRLAWAQHEVDEEKASPTDTRDAGREQREVGASVTRSHGEG